MSRSKYAGIPDCLHGLDDRQFAKIERFCEFLRANVPVEVLEAEDECVVTSALTFTIYATGLGDTIRCIAYGYRCDLTIDDDNELSSDHFVKTGVNRSR